MPGETITGIVKQANNRQFVLRSAERSYRPAPVEVPIRSDLARKFALVEGAAVTGTLQRKGGKAVFAYVESVGGLSPDAFRRRPRFADLVAVDPYERFDLGVCGLESMRIVDLIAPIGKGTRQLIVSPPKAGKTVLLEQIVQAILAGPSAPRVIVMLVDERPEEVTHFRRAVEGAEIVASTIDNKTEEHIELVELMLAHIQTELECGRHVVLLIDSLTRVARAFNTRGQQGGRRGHTMTGGLEAGIMEIPRRLFGLARRIENGGSVTVIATCLIDTGSRMDQLIFEEFKGTGNSEIVLDRALAEARIFPAIDIPASGTRKEARLYDEQSMKGLATLRRVLSNYGTRQAVEAMGKLLGRFPTNSEFLSSMTSAG